MIISKIRAFVIKYQIGSLMAITFLFFSCSKDAVVGNSTNTPTTKKLRTANFSSQQIFKGIFFADGPVADLIPELSEFKVSNFIQDPTALQNISALHDQLLVQFESNNPGYLSTFKDVMTNGNQVQIEAKLMEAANLLNTTLTAFYADASNQNLNNVDYLATQQEFKTALESVNINQQDAHALATFTKNYLETKGYAAKKKACLFLPVAVVAAAAVALAVVVWSVAVVIEGFWVFTSKHSVMNGNSLLKDKLVNSIATNL